MCGATAEANLEIDPAVKDENPAVPLDVAVKAVSVVGVILAELSSVVVTLVGGSAEEVC